MEIHALSIDLGKTIFHLVGLNASGETVVRSFRAGSCCISRGTCETVDWYGSLRGRPLLGTPLSRARP